MYWITICMSYLSNDCLLVAEVCRCLQSADAWTCVVPPTRTQFGDRSFAVAAVVHGSGIVYRLHCVTLTAFTASESSWRRFCLVVAAAHSDYVFCALLILLFTARCHAPLSPWTVQPVVVNARSHADNRVNGLMHACSWCTTTKTRRSVHPRCHTWYYDIVTTDHYYTARTH